jgi:hypothetical protein
MKRCKIKEIKRKSKGSAFKLYEEKSKGSKFLGKRTSNLLKKRPLSS